MSRPGGSPWGLSVPADPAGPSGRRLGPAPFSALFEIGARILRRHAVVLLLLALGFGLPAALLSSAAGVHFGETLLDIVPELSDGVIRVIDPTSAQLHALTDALLLVLAGSVLSGILGALAATGSAWIVERDYHGQSSPFGSAAAISLRRAPVVLGTVVLGTLATLGLTAIGGAIIALLLALWPAGPAGGGIGVFLALVAGVAVAVAVIVLSVRWSLAGVSAALEPVGPVTAMRRSWHLTTGHALRTLGVIIVVMVIVAVLGAIVTELLGIVVVDGLAAGGDGSLVAEAIITALVSVLFAPVAPVIAAVLYFDLRVRRDAWDVPPPA